MIARASIVVPAFFLAACAADRPEESPSPKENLGGLKENLREARKLATSSSGYCYEHGTCLECYNGGDDCGGTVIVCCYGEGCCSENYCSSQCWS
jgi:hypothetical protein